MRMPSGPIAPATYDLVARRVPRDLRPLHVDRVHPVGQAERRRA